MRKIITALGVVLIVMVGSVGIAAADTMTVDPENVEEAGEHEIEVSLSGFSAGIALFVLPCDYPESGNVEDMDVTTCDQANLTPVSMDDNGEGVVTVTLDIPDAGIGIIAGDAGQTEAAMALVSVGADAAAADDGGEELADTGLSTWSLSIIGSALLLLGAVAVRGSRRFGMA